MTITAARRTPYRGVPHQDRVAERRARLVEAAIRLYGTNGYQDTKVRDICAAAGLSERYFYESFANSEALLLAAFDLSVDRLFARLEHAIACAEPTPAGQIRAAITAYLADAAADPATTRLLLIEPCTAGPATEAAHRAAQFRLAGLVARIVSQNGTRAPRAGLSATLLSRALIGAFNALALSWLEEGFSAPLDEMIRTAMAVYAGMQAAWDAG